MSTTARTYLRAKAILLAIVLDETWSGNGHAVEMAMMDFRNAVDEYMDSLNSYL